MSFISKRLITIIVMTIIVHMSFGQTELYGIWTAKCTQKKINRSLDMTCFLCNISTLVDPCSGPPEFEIEFKKDTLILSRNEALKSLYYEFDEADQKIMLYEDDVFYYFKVLITKDPKEKILKDSSGMLIIIRKK
jgi:hypothetical protein